MAKSKNNKPIVITLVVVVAVVVIAVGGYFIFATPAKQDDWQPQVDTSSTQTTEQQATPSDTSSQTSSVVKGSYQIYETSKLVLANQGQVVLFFNAKWCPDCQRASKNFQSQPIPDGLTILSVDYDKYTDLKKKYGVTYQHTFVQVDASGNQIKKWSGSNTPADVEAQVQK